MPSGQADDEKQAPSADFPAQDDAKEDVAGDDLTNALASPLLEVNEMPSDFARLHYTSGFPFYKRYNLQYVDKDDSVLIFVSGNTVQLVDLSSISRSAALALDYSKHTVLQGHNVAVSAVAVHPSRQYFAVAETGHQPNIIIYEYPSLKPIKVLKRGTEKSYSDIAFSHNGAKLASVGGDPDYLLTIWDWEQEQVILHARAFSQDIFRVTFAPHDDRVVVTSGTGHIRFWKMAATFTGLKLQGDIGKFGKFDLSDIAAYAMLPSGKVLSGTETGDLLLWDGQFVQLCIRLPGGGSCHKGMVEYVGFEDQDRVVVTGGADGYVRLWSYDSLEFAEAQDDELNYTLEPTKEIFLGDGVCIRAMHRAADHYLVQSLNGIIYKIFLPSFDIQAVISAHAGAITSVATAPNSHLVLSGGMDGSLRLWDVHLRKHLLTANFNAPVRCVYWIPPSVDPHCRTVVVGFADGVLRLLKRYHNRFQLLQASKPHTKAVTELSLSPDGRILVTASEDGCLFLFSISKSTEIQLIPLGFTHTPAVYAYSNKLGQPPALVPHSLCWSHDSKKLLVAVGSEVIEYSRPRDDLEDSLLTSELAGGKNRDTYRIFLPHRSLTVVIPVIVMKSAYHVFFAHDEPLGPSATSDKNPKGKDSLGKQDGTNKADAQQETKSEAAKVHHAAPSFRPITTVRYGDNAASTIIVGMAAGRGARRPNKVSTANTAGKAGNHPVPPAHAPEHHFLFTCPIDDASVEPGSARHLSMHSHRKSTGIELTSGDPADEEEPADTKQDDGDMPSDASDDGAKAVDQDSPLSVSLCTAEQYVYLGSSFGSVTMLQLSHTGRYFVLGGSNGAVQVRPVRDLLRFIAVKPHDPYPSDSWLYRRATRSSGQGCILAANLSFDDRFLVTAGADGNMFSFVVNLTAAQSAAAFPVGIQLYHTLTPQTLVGDKRGSTTGNAVRALEQALAKSEVPVAATLIEDSMALPPAEYDDVEDATKDVYDVADIIDRTHYSIEEAKQKKEKDDQLAAAEIKKATLRQEISLLREEFKQIVEQNLSLPEHVRLPKDAFELDPELRLQLEEQSRRRVEEVEQELAWITEKRDIELKKVQEAFLDRVLVEHITLHAFRSNIFVTSFRVAELPQWLQDAIDEVDELVREEEAELQRRTTVPHTHGRHGHDDHKEHSHHHHGANRSISVSQADRRRHSSNLRARSRAHHVSEAEQRKQARIERREKRKALLASKPDKKVEDPQDVAAIAAAIETIGDYKLKSDPNYIVPEHQRVNSQKKRRQMILLQKSVHIIKMDYNKRFLAVRDLKKRIIESIQKDNIKLRELNHLLGIDEDLYEPDIDATEWPEWRDKCTDQDLIDFAAEMEREKKRAEKAKRSKFYEADEDEEEDLDDDAVRARRHAELVERHMKEKQKRMVQRSVSGTAFTTSKSGTINVLPPSLNVDNDDEELSPLELMERKQQKRILEHERSLLLNKMQGMVDSFDRWLSDLRAEKLRLDVDLKTADLKLLTLYQELVVLQEFEDDENKLFSRLKHSRNQKEKVRHELNRYEEQLIASKERSVQWEQRYKKLEEEFDQVVGGRQAQYYGDLRRIFEKKLKQKSMMHDKDDSSDSDDDYSDDDMSDGSSSDEDDSCPDGCDSALYEKVLELRSERHKLEQEREQLQQGYMELQKQCQQHQLQEDAIDKDLEATEADIQEFQSMKQKALNQIPVTLPLRLSQIRYLENGRLPGDISQALIFSSKNLQRLSRRIDELQAEKSQVNNQYKELKKSHKRLKKELKAKQVAIAMEKQKCEDVQRLKFGQKIDVTILEKVSSNPLIVEKQEELKRLERMSNRKLREWDEKIQAAKDTLAQVTVQNTQYLQRVAALTETQYQLEDQLNSTTKNVHISDTAPADEKAKRERHQLLRLVRAQEQEIEALKAEVHVLRRKGGRIYTPV